MKHPVIQQPRIGGRRHNAVLSAVMALFLAFISIGSLPAQTPTGIEAADAPVTPTDPERTHKDTLDQINASINKISTLEGRFFQIAPNGSLDEGAFYMRRPGRLRFEYDDPNPNLIVADGTWVILENRDLKTVDRYPLRATPLKLLLKKNVDLAKDAHVVAVEQLEAALLVTVRDDKDDAQGELTLIFSQPDLTLVQWVITDAQGLQTSIALRDVKQGTKINPALFVVRDANPFDRRP